MREKKKIKARTFHAILEIAVENPMLTPEQVAALLGRDVSFVKHVMQSDAFLELRAKRIIERYGEKINGIKGKILDTTADAIDAIRARIANPDATVNEAILLEAVKFLMPYVSPTIHDQNKPPEPGSGVTITLNLSDMQRAKQIQAERAHAIDITPPQQGQSPRRIASDKSGT
jgi:hypothetical protein